MGTAAPIDEAVVERFSNPREASGLDSEAVHESGAVVRGT